jgi:hypothetical protein
MFMGTQGTISPGLGVREGKRRSPTEEVRTLVEELAKVPYEPFLPVERQLVAWSLVLGMALLGLLIWVSERFFGG